MISAQHHVPMPGPETMIFSKTASRSFRFPVSVAAVVAACVVVVAAAYMDEDILIAERAAAAFDRDGRNILGVVVVVAAACNIAAVAHNIVVALDRSGNRVEALRDGEARARRDFHSVACVLVVVVDNGDARDSTCSPDAAVAAAVAVLVLPVQVNLRLFQRQLQSSLLRASSLYLTKVVASAPKGQPEHQMPGQLQSEEPSPVPQSPPLLLRVMKFRCPCF